MKITETRFGDLICPVEDSALSEKTEAQVQFLSSLLRPGNVVIDVGAGIGAFAIPLAKKVGAEGYVLALEAHAMLFYALGGNIALHGLTQVQAFNRAAGEKTNAQFYFPKLDFSQPVGSIRLASLLNAKDDQGRSYDNPVAAIAVDDLNIAAPNLIKIDVSGMELSVLGGLKRTLDRSKPYLFIDFSGNKELILDFLTSVGYQWTPHECGDYYNLICWHKTKRLEATDQYVVDLDQSTLPRHIQLREHRDANQPRDFKVC